MTSSYQPVFPDVGIIGLVHHQWDSKWLTPHHVLTRLGKYFHVVWVSPAHEWREIPKRLKGDSTGDGQIGDMPGFQIYTPEWWLPEFHRFRFLADFTLDQRVRNAKRILAQQGCKKIILYLWDYEFARALSSTPFDLSCYHIEDEYSFSAIEVPLNPLEARVISTVNEVFVISPAIMEKKGMINPHTTLVPHGVDYDRYATPVLEPTDIASIPRPRIGYSGFLKQQLNWPLLLQLAARHREYSFVFVGAQKHQEISPIINELSRLPNVYFLGSKPVDEFAYYPQHFDVCIMPYLVDDYTKYIFPLKLYEYLASGRPVVGSPIRSLQDFSHVIRLAKTPDEWSEALASSLTPHEHSDEQVKTRYRIARENDWSVHIHRLARIISARLGSSYEERFAMIPMGESQGSLIQARNKA